MVAQMPQPPDPANGQRLLRRFTSGQRWVHLSLATLMGVCLATAAMLYFGSLSALVGHRHLVATIHFVAGLLLPLPLVVGALASAAFRADIGRLNRFHPVDWAWLRSRGRRSELPSGKFNAGQKLNSAFVLGSVLVMFATGLMLHFFTPFSDDTRAGATLVHDLFATALAVVAAGHVWMAAHDPVARSGLRTGFVPLDWAESRHRLWARSEMAATSTQPARGGDRGEQPGTAAQIPAAPRTPSDPRPP